MKIGGLPDWLPTESEVGQSAEPVRMAPPAAEVARPAGIEGAELQPDILAEAPLVGSAAEAKLAEMAFQAEVVKQQLHDQVAVIPEPLPDTAMMRVANLPEPLPKPATEQVAVLPDPMPEPAKRPPDDRPTFDPIPMPRPAAGLHDEEGGIREDRMQHSDALSSETEDRALELQTLMDQKSQQETTLSNITKSPDDSADDLINNLK